MNSEAFRAAPLRNPFAGPRSLQRSDRIYGRDQEIRELFYLLVSERIVWLHSPSGAGKTSIVQAGLIPMLEEDGFEVLPVIRVSAAASAEGVNRFERSVAMSLGADPSRLQSLQELTGAKATSAGKPIVLIFDQFEEVLTLDRVDVQAKETFFRHLGKALQLREVWVLFMLREEFLPALDPYIRNIPGRLSHTFRLDLLGVDAAREAISGTARDGGRSFSDLALTRLADDLATVQIQEPGFGITLVPGRHVEPMQLQVVCRTLWDQTPESVQVFEPQHLATFGDVTTALAKYYATSVAEVAGRQEPLERRIREWFGERLISPGGIRNQVLEDDSGQGLDADTLMRLVDTHLIRSEERGGRRWYELAHDRLVEPVVSDNLRWMDAHLSWVQRRVDLWQRQQRPNTLLLADLELERAELWASRSPDAVTGADADFLRKSREHQAVLDRERTQAKRIRRLLAIAAALFLVAASAAGAALYLKQRAEDQEQLARSGELAASAISVAPTDKTLGLLLALRALSLRETLQAKEALHVAYQTAAGEPFPHTDNVQTVAFSPDGRWLATACRDQSLRVFDIDAKAPQLEIDLQSAVNGVSFSPDGRRITSATADGVVHMFAFPEGTKEFEFRAGGTGVEDVSFSPDGQTLATASGEGESVQTWNVQSRTRIARLAGHKGRVNRVAFDPSGRRLASGGSDGRLIMWEGTTPLVLRNDPKVEITSVRFSPDGSLLASTASDGTLQLWDTQTGVRQFQTIAYPGASVGAQAVAFSADGVRLATVSSQGVGRIWEMELRTPKPVLDLQSGRSESAFTIAFRPPEGHQVVIGGQKVRVYELRVPLLVRDSQNRLAPPGGVPRALTAEECRKYVHDASCPTQ